MASLPATCRPTWHQWFVLHGRLAPVRRTVWEEVLADWCAWPPTRASGKPTEAVTGVGSLGAEQGALAQQDWRCSGGCQAAGAKSGNLGRSMLRSAVLGQAVSPEAWDCVCRLDMGHLGP